MTKEQALNVLLQAVDIAQGKGAYNLADAKQIIMAIDTLGQPIKVEEEKEEKVEETDINS